ncbi:MAG: hypothetical protein ACRC1D_09370 [Culicoidibacterales bacterium]
METSTPTVRKSPRIRRKEDLARRNAIFEEAFRSSKARKTLIPAMPVTNWDNKKKKKKVRTSDNIARKKRKVTSQVRIRNKSPPPPESDSEDDFVDAEENNSDDSKDGDDDIQAVADNDIDSISDSSSRRGDHVSQTNHVDGTRQTSLVTTQAKVSPLPVDSDELLNVRGMSRSESMKNRQKHVAERVRFYVKSVIFRKIKFINSDAMFQKAINLVMDHEDVPNHQRMRFRMLYESVFNEALNTKRSSCEQSGGKIVREALSKFEESGEDFFSIEELTKLRRASTDRERNAFFWFYGTFLESVCGRRNWGKMKANDLISNATEKGGRDKVVTKSDEAFALLMFENYIDKWKSPPGNDDDRETNERGRKKQPRVRGKYTSVKSGHCKYGGWSHAGMARFNELYKIVEMDRASSVAEAMERELLAFCRKQMGSKHGLDVEQSQEGDNAEAIVDTEARIVEAAWDLDD